MELDHEESQRLEALSHWWRMYRGVVLSFVGVLILGVAAFQGFAYWNTQKSQDAEALFLRFQSALSAPASSQASSPPTPGAEKLLKTLQTDYGKSFFATEAGLLWAAHEASRTPLSAVAALRWVAEQGVEDLRPLACLRLARLEGVAKRFHEAHRHIEKIAAKSPWAPLARETEGDLFWAEGAFDKAERSYQKALKDLTPENPLYPWINSKIEAAQSALRGPL